MPIAGYSRTEIVGWLTRPKGGVVSFKKSKKYFNFNNTDFFVFQMQRMQIGCRLLKPLNGDSIEDRWLSRLKGREVPFKESKKYFNF